MGKDGEGMGSDGKEGRGNGKGRGGRERKGHCSPSKITGMRP